MHPIERLRMVARAAGEGPTLVAQEAAGALVAFGDDPAGLVTACRRLGGRQPTSRPRWWLAAAAVARHAGLPVWAVGGVGRVLPGRLWGALAARLEEDDEPWLAAEEVVPPDLVDNVVGPDGMQPSAQAAAAPTCPVAPEL